MDRKCMCMSICVMIALGAAFFVCGQAMTTRLANNPDDKKPPSASKRARLQRATMWCMELAKLMAVVSFLLILCCLCCKDVSFASHTSHASGYE